MGRKCDKFHFPKLRGQTDPCSRGQDPWQGCSQSCNGASPLDNPLSSSPIDLMFITCQIQIILSPVYPICKCCFHPLSCSTKVSHHQGVCTMIMIMPKIRDIYLGRGFFSTESLPCQSREKLTWVGSYCHHCLCYFPSFGQLYINDGVMMHFEIDALTYALVDKGEGAWFSSFGSTNCVARK